MIQTCGPNNKKKANKPHKSVCSPAPVPICRRILPAELSSTWRILLPVLLPCFKSFGACILKAETTRLPSSVILGESINCVSLGQNSFIQARNNKKAEEDLTLEWATTPSSHNRRPTSGVYVCTNSLPQNV